MKKKIKIKSCSNMSHFVLHEHYASHHHFDFRLEKFGTLKSWALPKGMPLKIGDRRLAIQTANHPISYMSFEGSIPKGQYGAGIVKIADRGCYMPKVWNESKIEIILYGKKYKGKYILIPLKGINQWLLLKGKDQP